MLRCVSTWFNTLQHTVTHCNTLQHTATPYNTLHNTTTHCNTIQHLAACCNTPQSKWRFSHVIHVKESCHTSRYNSGTPLRPSSPTKQPFSSHVTHTNDHVTHTNKPCQIYKQGLSHTQPLAKSRDAYERVMSHM